MTLARCPHCQTTFHASQDQIEQCGGKVRCGKCRIIFNALEHCPDKPGAVTPPAPAPAPALSQAATPEILTETESVHEIAETETQETTREHLNQASPDTTFEPPQDKTPTIGPEAPSHISPDEPEEPELDHIVTPREIREVPGYSKWNESTLSAPSMLFEEPKRAPWFSILLSFILLFSLSVQLTAHYRTDIAARWPDVRPWLEEACVSLKCDVPYPTNVDLINIVASELQIDPTRGNMLVLRLTLKNRAEFSQAYPSVELTLTDLRDNVVVRRTLSPPEYLPPKFVSTPAFAANSEIAATLWIDAKNMNAVGYQLFILYP